MDGWIGEDRFSDEESGGDFAWCLDVYVCEEKEKKV